MDPARLRPAEAARILGIAPETLEVDLAAGAPRNPDGTVNLLHVAAWLNLALAGRLDSPQEEPDGHA